MNTFRDFSKHVLTLRSNHMSITINLYLHLSRQMTYWMLYKQKRANNWLSSIFFI